MPKRLTLELISLVNILCIHFLKCLMVQRSTAAYGPLSCHCLFLGLMVFFFSPQYGIVVDAGSSRTTVYVYEWPAEKENDTGVVSQTFKCNVKGELKWKFLISF